MCGIIGYTGYSQATNVLIKGLKSLEYRGYDSAGIAVYNKNKSKSIVTKCTGRVANLENAVGEIDGFSGIGHTRWATHGEVSDSNSHPHKFGQVTIVHNGIIENYSTLKNALCVNDELKSQTDSEIIAVLIDKYFDGDAISAIIKAVQELTGTYGIAVMFDSIPDKIFAVRNVSPIVCCKNDDGGYIASDIMAIGEYSNEYFVLPEFSIAQITSDNITVFDFDKNIIQPKMLVVDWDIKNSGKGNYPFYMEKEIEEQPNVIEKTISSRINKNQIDFSNDKIDETIFKKCNNISIVACGTAMHAGLIGKYLIESICKIPVSVHMASEYMYNEPIIKKDTLAIFVSQSGETIDTLEALKYAKRKGAMTLSIVNVKGSSIARESDNVIYTNAGPEIAVASTKAYTTQLAVFYLITAKLKNEIDATDMSDFLEELKKLPSAVKDVLERKNDIHHLSKTLLSADHTFMIGRGLDYPALLEASLKLKEISYIHSEAFASGELKHGTIALITNETPVISLQTQTNLSSKQHSNVKEVQSRGANVISFVKKSLATSDLKNYFELPDLKDEFMVVPAVVSLQLLAYYVSSDKGLDVDKPRNLAKVVTVE